MRRAAPLIYAGLALALAGPLLIGRGVVLAVDLGQSPHPQLDSAYWGLPQGTRASRTVFTLVKDSDNGQPVL